MSDSSAGKASDGGLCPGCEYPREGLPPNHPCPECGLADEILVSARGWQMYQPSWATTLMSMVAAAMFIGLAIWLRRRIGFAIMFGILAIVFGLLAYAEIRGRYLARGGKGELRVAVTPRGVLIYGDARQERSWDEVYPSEPERTSVGMGFALRSRGPMDPCKKVFVECDEATADRFIELLRAHGTAGEETQTTSPPPG